MTDELSIQKQQPSAIPYVALGAAGVGGASYLGLPRIESVNKFMTEPAKYNSYEDIIKEADDTFENSLKSAEGTEKDLMEKAKNYREKVGAAGKEYDDKLAKEIADKAKPEKAPELPADHEAKKAYQAKRQELINKEIERLKTNNKETVKKNVEKATESTSNKISDVVKSSDAQKNLSRTSSLLENARTEFNTNNIRLNQLIDSVAQRKVDIREQYQVALSEIEANFKSEMSVELEKKLPKVEGKTEQAVKEAFVKANGSREEYIKKATDGLKDDIKALCEGKRGGKFWGIIAGTAALGGAIGLLFRPKAKDV